MAQKCNYGARIHEHLVRHGRPHAKAHAEWSPIHCLETGKDAMQTSKQGTNDCGIHVCVIPVLLSSNIPLQVLGANHWHWAKAGAELRQRLCLTFETGEYQFRKRIVETKLKEPNEAEITEHEDDMSHDSKINDVVREVSNSVKKNKRKPATKVSETVLKRKKTSTL